MGGKTAHPGPAFTYLDQTVFEIGAICCSAAYIDHRRIIQTGEQFCSGNTSCRPGQYSFHRPLLGHGRRYKRTVTFNHHYRCPYISPSKNKVQILKKINHPGDNAGV